MHVVAIGLLSAMSAPYGALGEPVVHTEPYQKEFVITAYYSPLPGQCCYVKGGYLADKILNGEGHTAADGTGVYPGMIAAPKSYPFNTKITLPGLGTLTVHDRGGAITEKADGSDRLDIWAGYGEEGLARALEFGVKRVLGTVYPVASTQPETAFDLATLPAPVDQLSGYFIEKDNFLALRPKEGDSGLSVTLLQEYLKEIGYLQHSVTGFFGPETAQAFTAFLRDFQVDAPTDALSETSAAYVLGARSRLDARDPLTAYVDPDASEQSIADAQRILRFLGYYRGRTDGQYGDALFAAILKFQQEYRLVGTADDNGAGRIGPLTSTALHAAWNRKVVSQHAKRHLDRYAVDVKITEQNQRIVSFLEEGDTGHQVSLLQAELAALGFFPEKDINGSYGPQTKDAVADYQFDRRLIETLQHEAAGFVGPGTLRSLQSDQRNILYRVVRAQGWKAL